MKTVENAAPVAGQHTPGPTGDVWRCDGEAVQYSEDGGETFEDYATCADSGIAVAVCNLMNAANGIHDDLISAAPDLLAALKRAQEIIDKSDLWASGAIDDADIELIDAAIAKAEGR